VLGCDAYERLKIFRVLFKAIYYWCHFDGLGTSAEDGEEFDHDLEKGITGISGLFGLFGQRARKVEREKCEKGT